MNALKEWWDWNGKTLFVVLFWIVVFVAIVAGIIGGAYLVDKQFCSQMERVNTGYQFVFSFWLGCRVQTPDGYYVNAREYQFNELEINK